MCIRDRSVSSTRNTKVPPWWRANAQLYSAVRTLPTCRSPLGAGANRTRTAAVEPPASSTTRDHRVGQGADAFDRDRNLVAHLHRPDAGGGAREDDVAGQQGHARGDVGDQRRDLSLI